MFARTEPQYDDLGQPISPARVYWIVFGALLFLTGLTYLVSFVDLGPASLVIALLIAAAQASLVWLFFMHSMREGRLNALVFASSIFFMGIFLALTMMDVRSRALIDPLEGYGVIEGRAALTAEMVAAAEAAAVEGAPEAGAATPESPAAAGAGN